MADARLLPEQIPAPGAQPFTYQEYLALPDDGRRYEILAGDLFMSPSPSIRHHDVLASLFVLLRACVSAGRLGKVFISPVDVVLSEINVLQPDLFFVSQERLALVGEKNVPIAPDLVVEVLSPSGDQRDRRIKKGIYQRFGVAHYWILDPDTRRLEEFVLQQGSFELRTALAGAVPFSPAAFSGLTLDLGQVWP